MGLISRVSSRTYRRKMSSLSQNWRTFNDDNESIDVFNNNNFNDRSLASISRTKTLESEIPLEAFEYHDFHKSFNHEIGNLYTYGEKQNWWEYKLEFLKLLEEVDDELRI